MSGSWFAGDLKKMSGCDYIQRAGRNVGKRDSVLVESYPNLYPKVQTRIAFVVDDGRTGLNLNAGDAIRLYAFSRHVICRLFSDLLCVFFEVVILTVSKTCDRIKEINGRL
jgi:hypothetical protein